MSGLTRDDFFVLDDFRVEALDLLLPLCNEELLEYFESVPLITLLWSSNRSEVGEALRIPLLREYFESILFA